MKRENGKMDLDNVDAAVIADGISDGADVYVPPAPAYGSEWKDKRFRIDKGYSFWLNASPVKMYPGCELPASVSSADCGKLYRCAMMLQKNTNMLFYHSNGFDKPLTTEKLADKLGINRQRCYMFVQRMCDMHIMARESGRLYINPIFFFRGRHLSYSLYQMFQEDLDSVLPQWVIDRFNGDVHA